MHERFSHTLFLEIVTMPHLTKAQIARILELKFQGEKVPKIFKVLKQEWPKQLEKLDIRTVYSRADRSGEFVKNGAIERKVRISHNELV